MLVVEHHDRVREKRRRSRRLGVQSLLPARDRTRTLSSVTSPLTKSAARRKERCSRKPQYITYCESRSSARRTYCGGLAAPSAVALEKKRRLAACDRRQHCDRSFAPAGPHARPAPAPTDPETGRRASYGPENTG